MGRRFFFSPRSCVFLLLCFLPGFRPLASLYEPPCPFLVGDPHPSGGLGFSFCAAKFVRTSARSRSTSVVVFAVFSVSLSYGIEEWRHNPILPRALVTAGSCCKPPVCVVPPSRVRLGCVPFVTLGSLPCLFSRLCVFLVFHVSVFSLSLSPCSCRRGSCCPCSLVSVFLWSCFPGVPLFSGSCFSLFPLVRGPRSCAPDVGPCVPMSLVLCSLVRWSVIPLNPPRSWPLFSGMKLPN